jgi:OOP family OmpA-OmpF porin
MKYPRASQWFLVLSALLAASAAIHLYLKMRPQHGTVPPPSPAAAEGPREPAPPIAPDLPGDAGGTAMEAGSPGSPGELAGRIAGALHAGDLRSLARIAGEGTMDDATAARLAALIAGASPGRKAPRLREVGELELGKRVRWAIEPGSEEDKMPAVLLDLTMRDGKWEVDAITLGPAAGEAPREGADPLQVADAFLQAVRGQRFGDARALADPSKVSDVKIAGLCILFEEGAYRLRAEKPLRTIFERVDTVGYLAAVESPDASQGARFSLTLRRKDAAAAWRVGELNLDDLLADHARRLGGGDIHYSPLVRNPSGGDMIALYFGFDDALVSPRSERQLAIVAAVLRADPSRRLRLSGHADAMGAEPYNRGLSMRRAEAVRDFLIASGVEADRIRIDAKGSSQPRLPNVTEAGTDNPAGRRVNRRAEIFLDF